MREQDFPPREDQAVEKTMGGCLEVSMTEIKASKKLCRHFEKRAMVCNGKTL